MNEIIVPAFTNSHSSRRRPISGRVRQNGPILTVRVNESVWATIQEVARLEIGGRAFRTINIWGTGIVEITNFGGT